MPLSYILVSLIEPDKNFPFLTLYNKADKKYTQTSIREIEGEIQFACGCDACWILFELWYPDALCVYIVTFISAWSPSYYI